MAFSGSSNRVKFVGEWSQNILGKQAAVLRTSLVPIQPADKLPMLFNLTPPPI